MFGQTVNLCTPLLTLRNYVDHSPVTSNSDVLMFQRCIVIRRFYISYEKVKITHSLPRAYAVFCGRFIITVN